ncbi:MAG: helix-turn-helix domain-containing protein [Burkholderiaceae bacterium]
MSAIRPSGDMVKIGSGQLLAQMLDVLDCGALVINRQCELIQTNTLAKTNLRKYLRFSLVGETVLPADSNRELDWTTAVNAASLGNGRYVAMDNTCPPRPLSLQSIDIGLPLGCGLAVLVCGSRSACATDAGVRAYAKSAGLTRTETQTLNLILAGNSPVEIADIRGVSEYTVRAQIKSLYRRTNTRSVRELLISVGNLPPVRATR